MCLPSHAGQKRSACLQVFRTPDTWNAICLRTITCAAKRLWKSDVFGLRLASPSDETIHYAVQFPGFAGASNANWYDQARHVFTAAGLTGVGFPQGSGAAEQHRWEDFSEDDLRTCHAQIIRVQLPGGRVSARLLMKAVCRCDSGGDGRVAWVFLSSNALCS